MDETGMAASSLLIWLSRVQAPSFAEDLSNFVFFRAIYDFLHSEIDEFAIHLLGRTMTLVGTAAMTLLTLWILIRGYRIVTGQSRQPMMTLVTDSLRATLILGLATGMAVGGSTLYDFLGTGLSQVISEVVTGTDTPVNERIDRNLAYLQLAWSSIEAVDTSGDRTLAAAKSRALWFTGIGIAGPSITGGALLLLNQIAMALFIGLGPLFVVSLLFESTRPLFGRWLHYGIGTMFSLTVLSTMVSIALKMVLAVAATFWVGHVTGIGEGISSLALQQGGIGVILTALILSAPPMAAAFFGGVLGNFIPFSVFGGGGRRSYPDHASPASLGFDPTAMANAPTLGTVHHYGTPNGVSLDQIKQPPANANASDTFLDRYPSALASNALIGGGDPLPTELQLTTVGTAGIAHIDANGYLQDAGITKHPVAALEKGPLDGPHAIVLHRTVSSTASSTLAAFERGVGTHFVIDKDGTIYQSASLSQRTAHVGPIRSRCLIEGTCGPDEATKLKSYSPKQGHNHEKVKSYPDRYPMNEDSVGIEVVGMYWEKTEQWDAPTEKQKESISHLIGLLQANYSMTDADVYEHDKISRKTAGEGAGLYDGADRMPAKFPPPFF